MISKLNIDGNEYVIGGQSSGDGLKFWLSISNNDIILIHTNRELTENDVVSIANYSNSVTHHDDVHRTLKSHWKISKHWSTYPLLEDVNAVHKLTLEREKNGYPKNEFVYSIKYTDDNTVKYINSDFFISKYTGAIIDRTYDYADIDYGHSRRSRLYEYSDSTQYGETFFAIDVYKGIAINNNITSFKINIRNVAKDNCGQVITWNDITEENNKIDAFVNLTIL